jgi:hypothetical protein
MDQRAWTGRSSSIAEAGVKTDKVDAAILSGLLAADYLPSVWLPDAETGTLRRRRSCGSEHDTTKGKLDLGRHAGTPAPGQPPVPPSASWH